MPLTAVDRQDRGEDQARGLDEIDRAAARLRQQVVVAAELARREDRQLHAPAGFLAMRSDTSSSRLWNGCPAGLE